MEGKKKMAACRVILINKRLLQLVWDACTHWEVSPMRSCGVYSEEPSPHPFTSPLPLPSPALSMSLKAVSAHDILKCHID